MKGRTTLILLLAVLALAAFIRSLRRRRPDPSSAPAGCRRLVRVEPDRTADLRLRNGDFEVRCRRDGADWTMTMPVKTRADAGEIERILWRLHDLPCRDVITAREQRRYGRQLADYGLENPRARITVQDDAGRRVLLIGRETPLGKTVYVMQKDRDEIMVTDAAILDLAPTSEVPLRDRRLFRGDAYEATRVEIRGPSGFLQVARSAGGDWRLAAADRRRRRRGPRPRPGGGPLRGADRGVRDGPPADPAPYGLDDDAWQVSVWSGGQPSPRC